MPYEADDHEGRPDEQHHLGGPEDRPARSGRQGGDQQGDEQQRHHRRMTAAMRAAHGMVAGRVVAETRRRLYGILAEDDEADESDETT